MQNQQLENEIREVAKGRGSGVETLRKIGSEDEEEVIGEAVETVKRKMRNDDFAMVAMRLNYYVQQLERMDTIEADTNVNEFIGGTSYWGAINQMSSLPQQGREYEPTAIGALKGLRDACEEVADDHAVQY